MEHTINAPQCAVAECLKSVHARGWCAGHYTNWRHHGVPVVPKASLEERFWAKVDKRGSGGCWEWTAGKDWDGYGMFKTPGGKYRQERAHRFSLALHLGRPIAPGMLACHKCDNPACVNPSHLYEGTVAENHRDCGGRDRRAYGERVGTDRRKLTEAQVVMIRELRASGATIEALAKRFGIGKSTTGRIVLGQAWERAGGPITRKRAQLSADTEEGTP